MRFARTSSLKVGAGISQKLDLEPDGGVRAVVNVFERLLNFGESRNGLERIPGRG
ncbi:MAG: hypothetical protein V8T46_09000 [Sutterella seckii]